MYMKFGRHCVCLALTCRCPVIGHVQFLSNILSVQVIAMKGTPFWQTKRKLHSMHSCNHYRMPMLCRCPTAECVQFISYVSSVQDMHVKGTPIQIQNSLYAIMPATTKSVYVLQVSFAIKTSGNVRFFKCVTHLHL